MILSFNSQTDSKKLKRLFVMSALLPTIIALTIAFLFLWQIQALKNSFELEMRSQKIISEANLVLRLIVDGQTSIRGYIISKNKSFLAPYEEAVEIIPKKFEYLLGFVADNLEQTKTLQEALNKFFMWRHAAEIRIKNTNRGIIKNESNSGSSRNLMNDIRENFNSFISSEENLRLIRSNNLRGKTNLLIIFGVSLSLLLGVVLSFFTKNAILFITKTLTTAITEAKNMAIDLSKAVNSRDEFISVASHELKTPLTSLKLRLDMTLRSIDSTNNVTPSTSKLQKDLSMCSSQITRMANLIDELLDISRIQLGRLNLNFEKINLSELTKETVGFYKEQLKEVGCSLTLSIEENVFINCDPFRIDQVLVNLLSNAIKYGAGHPVSVVLKKEGTNALLQVRDSGIGIEKNMQSYIFNRFERAENSQVISGLGLGLYITKEIITAHRGEISVESELEKGSTFTVTLPIEIQLEESRRSMLESPDYAKT